MKELESQAKGLDFSKLTTMNVVKDASQKSEEWYEQRRYKFTSSCIHKLMTEPRSAEAKKNGELSETAKSYILEKVTEEMGGEIPEFSSPATRWGEDNEENARKAYVAKTSLSVEAVGFVQHNEFYGGSPDNIVLDNLEEHVVGALEIKCPYNSINHVKHLLIRSADYFKQYHTDYYWQCISHMVTLDCHWCDFVSYDPRLKLEEKRLCIYRLYRNEEDAKALKDKLETALEYKKEIKKQLGI